MTAHVLDAQTLETLVSAAVAAPSLHTTQPWRFRLDPDTASTEVRAATGRNVRLADPLGRGLHVSVGAAVFNLRVAVGHFGWEPVVRLLPRPDDPALLATVRPAGPPSAAGRLRPDLYDALWHRRSSRFPFSGRIVAPRVLAEISDAAAAQGARLAFPDPPEVTRVLPPTAEAERYNDVDRHRRQESHAWVRDGSPDGVPDALEAPST